MMKNKLSILSFIVIGAVIAACSPQAKLDKLKEKRAQLKTELNEIDAQIRAMDTVKETLLPLVRTGKSRMGSFIHQINVQGEVSSDRTVMVNAEANGILESIKVVEGQSVKKGQVLAEIDTEILSSNIQEVKTRLEFAEYNYSKQKELFDRGVGTEFELEQASNQLKTLKSQLETLQTQRSKAIVKAPFEGIVDEIMSNEGEMTGMQSPLLRLVNNKEVKVAADISEHYYTKVQEGTKAKAYFPTLQDTVALEITSTGNYIHPTNRTFRVQSVVKDNEKLLPNMLADLFVTDLKLDSTLVVPAESLLKSQKNEDYIFVLEKEGDNWVAKQVFVEVISRYKGEAAISTLETSLSEGAWIVTEGGRGITDGDKVRTR